MNTRRRDTLHKKNQDYKSEVEQIIKLTDRLVEYSQILISKSDPEYSPCFCRDCDWCDIVEEFGSQKVAVREAKKQDLIARYQVSRDIAKFATHYRSAVATMRQNEKIRLRPEPLEYGGGSTRFSKQPPNPTGSRR